ncbi:MAG: hypothetical protein VX223_00780 [Myxococcota bacterium]|nr:hypothetical protein [Myxococcota bacterium]
MKQLLWLFCLLISIHACGSNSLQTSDMADISTSDVAPSEVQIAPDMSISDILVDSADEIDTATNQPIIPPQIVYETPDLAGDRTDSTISALGSVAVQPAIAVGNSGQPIVVFAGTSNENSDLGIYVSTPGQPTTPVRTEPSGQRNEPSICRLSDEGFVAVWSYDGQAVGNPLGVEGAIFAADGSILSSFDVKTEVEGNHWLGHVGCNPSGGFTVAGSRTDTDGTTFGVFAQHFRNDGTVLDDAFIVNPAPEGTQVQPVVGVTWGGTGVVMYEDAPTDGDYRLNARTFDPSGVVSSTFTILASEGADALKPAIALSHNGRVAYAGNIGGQIQVLSAPSLQSPEPTEPWVKTFGSFIFPAITYLSTDTELAMVSLVNVTRSGAPAVRVEILTEGSNASLSSVSLGDDPNLPPYPPSIGYGGGVLAVAWTQRTDDGFEVHQSTFVGSAIKP